MSNILPFPPRPTSNGELTKDGTSEEAFDRDRINCLISDMQSDIDFLRQFFQLRRIELEREREHVRFFLENQRGRE
jgi:hypothetical protein